jgi:hypothetical protein
MLKPSQSGKEKENGIPFSRIDRYAKHGAAADATILYETVTETKVRGRRKA